MNKNYFICPHCQQLGFSIAQKLMLTPFTTAVCSRCGIKASIHFYGWAVEITIILASMFAAGFAGFITGSGFLRWIIFIAGFLLAAVFRLLVTPLNEKKPAKVLY